MRFVSRVCFNQIEPGQIQSLVAAITLLLIGLVTITLGNAAQTAVEKGASGGSWPQWRGPQGQGHAPTAVNVPRLWSENQNICWKTPVPGRGWSSPVIAGDQIWLTTAIESVLSEDLKKKRLEGNTNSQALTVSGPISLRAICIDRASGKIVKEIECLHVDEPDPIHTLNSFASPTPILDADRGRLYCHFGTNGTACIDTTTETGHVLWRNQDQRIAHENGPGSTPVLFEDFLIFDCDGSDRQYVVALDTKTGTVAWKTDRSGTLNENPQLKKAYGTPLLLEIEGKQVLLSTGADWLYGYDPKTGRELWKMSYGVLGFSIVPRPVAAHGMLYVSTSFMQPELLGVRLGDAVAVPEIMWRVKKGAPTMPSPLVIGDELYMVSDKGVATCLDARSGEVRWSERLGGNFCSSPMFADDRIYVGNREGQVFVIEPGKTFVLEATNTLEGEVMATPAAIDHSIYLRTDKAMYRIEKK